MLCELSLVGSFSYFSNKGWENICHKTKNKTWCCILYELYKVTELRWVNSWLWRRYNLQLTCWIQSRLQLWGVTGAAVASAWQQSSWQSVKNRYKSFHMFLGPGPHCHGEHWISNSHRHSGSWSTSKLCSSIKWQQPWRRKKDVEGSGIFRLHGGGVAYKLPVHVGTALLPQ